MGTANQEKGEEQEQGKAFAAFAQKLIAKLYGLCEWSVSGQSRVGEGGEGAGCAAAMPITMSATCHLNNIKLIAENLPPSSSIEWLRSMGVVWPIFQGGWQQLQEAIGLYVCMFSTICHCLLGPAPPGLKGASPAAYAPG